MFKTNLKIWFVSNFERMSNPKFIIKDLVSVSMQVDGGRWRKKPDRPEPDPLYSDGESEGNQFAELGLDSGTNP